MEKTMNIIRNTLIVSLLVVLVLPTSFAFAAGIEDVKGLNFSHCPSNEFVQANSLSFSGDDLYDSAADLLCVEASADINAFSANPELSVDEVAYDWSQYFGYGPLEILNNTDAATVSAEINAFSANPELMVSQRYAVPASKGSETCSADCYDNY
jgi:hypothetical protein